MPELEFPRILDIFFESHLAELWVLALNRHPTDTSRRSHHVLILDLNGFTKNQWTAGVNISGSTIAVDGQGNVIVGTTSDYFTYSRDGVLLGQLGSRGIGVLQNGSPAGNIAPVGPDRVFMLDGHDRVKQLRLSTQGFDTRAIAVAAGGPYPGNNLWEATQANATFAYRTLQFQGFDSETIQYLSSDLNLDLNTDGLPDVDADATNEQLRPNSYACRFLVLAVKAWTASPEIHRWRS